MNTLHLAWRQPDQRWWPVAQLTRAQAFTELRTLTELDALASYSS